jgi:hypothetical protein
VRDQELEERIEVGLEIGIEVLTLRANDNAPGARHGGPRQ